MTSITGFNSRHFHQTINEREVSDTMMRDEELRDLKLKLFAVEYMLTWDATKAARAVGYSGESARVTGHNLKDDKRVRVYMDYLKDLVKHANQYTDKIAKLEEVLVTMTRVLRREEPNQVANVITQEEVTFNGRAKESKKAGKVEVTDLKTPVSDVLKAADMLMKYYAAGSKDDGAEHGVVILPEVDDGKEDSSDGE